MQSINQPFYNAAYWVGCSTESALRIFFSFENVKDRISDFDYIAAFDKTGHWIDEAQVNENSQLVFNY